MHSQSGKARFPAPVLNGPNGEVRWATMGFPWNSCVRIGSRLSSWLAFLEGRRPVGRHRGMLPVPASSLSVSPIADDASDGNRARSFLHRYGVGQPPRRQCPDADHGPAFARPPAPPGRPSASPRRRSPRATWLGRAVAATFPVPIGPPHRRRAGRHAVGSAWGRCPVLRGPPPRQNRSIPPHAQIFQDLAGRLKDRLFIRFRQFIVLAVALHINKAGSKSRRRLVPGRSFRLCQDQFADSSGQPSSRW